jgi:hypothetical protein
MTASAQRRHALAQFEPRYTMPYWAAGDATIALPWWVAVPTYPLIIGSRILLWAGMVPFQALRNYLSWTSAERAAFPSHQPFLLVLRTFGDDGGMLLPPAPGHAAMAPRAATLEQIVGEIAETVGLSSVGFADHAVGAVPPGVRYHKAQHDDWRGQFERLASLASAIVVMPTPGRPLGPNFRSELEFLRAHGLARKSIVVGPPGLDAGSRAATHEIYRALGWPEVRHGHLTAFVGDDGRLTVNPAFGDRDDFLAARYQENIDNAIQQVIRRRSA